MKSTNKNTVLLLGHDFWQERTLVLTLKLGGYVARVVEDTNEAINLIKKLPETVNSLLIPGTGCQAKLNERLMCFEANDISTPVYLIGSSIVELEENRISIKNQLKLSSCLPHQLLECLNQ